ncbi:hypothetical protein RHGRI_032548 [Rhododendron griersonianum]|uniref:Cyclin C-terminal domain-containing protein n=1 Tax=Rhododendron griersonianum TaxID=479676 RepID=A0AAV6IG18_9ERIC|nr:hypothetical protein RHGRI_032548 [Rhododendron griersonianum]
METVVQHSRIDPLTNSEVVRLEKVWNYTIADITLLAFGTSFPQISLATIDAIRNLGNLYAGASAIPLGFEHHMVMLGTTVIIPSIIVPLMGGGQKEKAEVIQTSLFVTGLNTLLQTWFGTRLPVVIGSSYSFIAPALFTVLSDRYTKYVDPLERFEKSMRGIQGAMMIASIIPILLGFFGIWRIIVSGVSFTGGENGGALRSTAPRPPNLRTHVFEPQTVQRMELWVMASLNWRLRSVTPFDYIDYFVSKLPRSGSESVFSGPVIAISSDLILNTLRVIDFLGFPPSIVAAAAVVAAAGESADLPETFYERENKERVRSCLQLMEEYLMDPSVGHKGRSISEPPPPPSPDGVSAAITLGFEHHVVMLGTTVIIPSIIVPLMGGGQKEKAEVIQTSLFVAGLNTLLQTWFETRLPVVIGSSYSFIALGLFIVLSDRYSKYVDPLERFEKSMRGIQGAMMIASIIPILLGFFALLTASGAYGNTSPSTQISCRVDRSGLISGAAWVSFPYPWQWGSPSAEGAGDAFVMIAAALVALIEFNTIVEIIFTSPATVAVLITVFLDCTIRTSRTDSGIFDNGRHWWERFRDFEKHPMSREFYYLPSGLTKYFPSV